MSRQTGHTRAPSKGSDSCSGEQGAGVMARVRMCAVRGGASCRASRRVSGTVQPWLQTSEEAQSRSRELWDGEPGCGWCRAWDSCPVMKPPMKFSDVELGLEGCRSLGRMGRPRFSNCAPLEPRFPTEVPCTTPGCQSVRQNSSWGRPRPQIEPGPRRFFNRQALALRIEGI